jgi:hypothetical protein
MMMSISDRYRRILETLEEQSDRFYERLPAEATKPLRLVDQAAEELQTEAESVGEIPQLQLESRLTPIIIRAHGKLDRARVSLDDEGYQQVARQIWELEQLLYRLLNDL